MTNRGPTDAELRAALGDGLGAPIDTIQRAQFAYATSSPLEELTVTLRDGRRLSMILKQLDRRQLLDEARRHRPAFVHEPRRPIETYRRLLGPAGIGARFHAAMADRQQDRHWLVVEKVEGPVLWQVGDIAVWEHVAHWLADFHTTFAGRADEIRGENPHLIEIGPDWWRTWWDRAIAALRRSDAPRDRRLIDRLAAHQNPAQPSAGPVDTLVHGEFYPSNVLVELGSEPVRVCPVDWEMAGIGPGLLDLAALSGGWDDNVRATLLAAYVDRLRASGTDPGHPDEITRGLDHCRLHLALQWLGWSSGWEAPAQHTHDWVGEALVITDRLGW